MQAFADILASNETFAAPMEETYKLLDLNPEDTTTLEQYLQVSRSPPVLARIPQTITYMLLPCV